MTTLLLSLVAGAVVGLALGALGGGGGVLAVPALVYLLGASPAQAGTASLLVVLASAATALVGHVRAGQVRLRTGVLFGVAGIAPSAAAAVVSVRLPSAVLTGSFALLAAVAGVTMLRGRVPAEPVAGRPVAVMAAGAGVGAVTGLLGVGGGFLVVPALARVLRMRAAVGTGLVVVLLNSTTALAARLAEHPQLPAWSVIGPFAGAALLGAWDGKRLAGRVSEDVLRRVFAVVLLLVAAGMAVDAVSGR